MVKNAPYGDNHRHGAALYRAFCHHTKIPSFLSFPQSLSGNPENHPLFAKELAILQ